MDFLRRLFTQLSQIWQRMGLTSRIGLGAAVVLAIGLLSYVTFWAAQPNYVELVRDVPLEDAARITDVLKAQNIPYQQTGGGGRILIPAERLQEQRMRLAIEDLPSGPGKGFELFDGQTPFGTTPFQERLTYLRAIQSELARTIGTLEPVKNARVLINIPEETPFVREKKPVTASVVITAKRGTRFDRHTIDGIVSLVAGAVKVLEKGNVTVVDSTGRTLSERPDPLGEGAPSKHLEFVKSFEDYQASKAEAVLSRVLGMGNAVVRVTAVINFKKVKEVYDLYDPENRAIKSERIKNSKQTGSAAPIGVPGTASNVPPVIQPAGATGQTGSSEESIDTEYETSRTQRWVEDMTGAVQKLSVAVMVIPPPRDPSIKIDPAAPPDPPQAALTEEQIKANVKAAIGLDETRGDTISVTVKAPIAEPFQERIEDEIAFTEKLNQWANVLRWGAALVAAVVGGFLLIFWVRSRSRRAEEAARPVISGVPGDLTNLEAVAETLRIWMEDA